MDKKPILDVNNPKEFACSEVNCHNRIVISSTVTAISATDDREEWEFYVGVDIDGTLYVAEAYCGEHSLQDSLDSMSEKVEDLYRTFFDEEGQEKQVEQLRD